MNTNKSVLQISIYYPSSSKSKSNLNKHLVSYTKRLSSSPSINISLDSFHVQREKIIQQELLYDTITTCGIKQTLPTIREVYAVIVLLISLTTQRLYENNQNTKTENWMILSITPSKSDDRSNREYEISWSLGK
jgi:hypothetical protein